MKNFIVKLVLWLWSIFIKNPITTAMEAARDGMAPVAKKLKKSAHTMIVNGKLVIFRKAIYHIDNTVGRWMQKTLLEKGIVVILYSSVSAGRGKGKGKGMHKHARYFMMMGHMNAVITATLDAPHDSEGRAKLGEKIQLKGAGTLYITIPPAMLLALTPFITAMRNAVGEAQVQTAWDNLNAALKEIMDLVQHYMNDHRNVAEVCCVYHGFKVKGKGGNTKREWGGVSGTVTGSIDLTFEVIEGVSCFDILLWDRLHTSPPTRAQPTDQTEATVPDLVSGALQAVSYNAIKDGIVVFESGIIDVRVK